MNKYLTFSKVMHLSNFFQKYSLPTILGAKILNFQTGCLKYLQHFHKFFVQILSYKIPEDNIGLTQ